MLKASQQIFWELIVAPHGVEEALRNSPRIALDQWFKGDAKLPAVRRLSLYANMYFWRIHDALREDYPELFSLLGEKKFKDLITDYLLAHPSATPLLQHVGRHLPEFIVTHPFSQQWPHLADLARLEWEIAILFEAPNAATLSLKDLKKIPAAQWPAFRFQLIPAFKIWKRSRPTPALFRIWRQNFVTYHREISEEEKEALEMIQRGETFQAVCEKLGNAETAAQFLAGWVDSGLIASLQPEK